MCVKIPEDAVIDPKFGSWTSSFLTQRRRGAEKTARFEFFESYLLLCNPTPSTPDGRRFIPSEKFSYFPFSHYFTFSLRYFVSRGPLRPFGFASLRQPDDATACAPYGARPVASGNLTTSSQVHLVAGASRLCVEINSRF